VLEMLTDNTSLLQSTPLQVSEVFISKNWQCLGSDWQ